MALTSFMTQLDEIDVTKGYGDNTQNSLADGVYNGYVENFNYIDKENGGMFILNLKTLEGTPHTVFYFLIASTFKFKMKELMVSLYRIINDVKFDTPKLQVEALQNPSEFCEKMKSLMLGKPCTFELKSNAKGFQNTTICEKEEMPF